MDSEINISVLGTMSKRTLRPRTVSSSSSSSTMSKKIALSINRENDREDEAVETETGWMIPFIGEEHIQCVVCHDLPMTTPVGNCEMGHIICKRCHHFLRSEQKASKRMHTPIVKCPVCRVDLLPKLCRNLLADLILTNINKKRKLTCRFEGCETTDSPEKIVEHEKRCEMRTLQCPYDKCNWFGLSKELENHLTDKKCVPVNNIGFKFVL